MWCMLSSGIAILTNTEDTQIVCEIVIFLFIQRQFNNIGHIWNDCPRCDRPTFSKFIQS